MWQFLKRGPQTICQNCLGLLALTPNLPNQVFWGETHKSVCCLSLPKASCVLSHVQEPLSRVPSQSFPPVPPLSPLLSLLPPDLPVWLPKAYSLQSKCPPYCHPKLSRSVHGELPSGRDLELDIRLRQGHCTPAWHSGLNSQTPGILIFPNLKKFIFIAEKVNVEKKKKE